MLITFPNKQHMCLNIQILLILLACLFSQGHFHFDEHFQILEFLNFKLGKINPEQLPWEFTSQMRPWGQVFIYFILTKFFSFFYISDPFILPVIFRLITAFLAIASLFLTMKFLQMKWPYHNTQNWLFATVFTLWFWPFLSARISSECFNGLLFYNCTLIYLLYFSRHFIIKFAIFFIMFTAVWGRLQLAPALLGFCFWTYVVDKSLQGNLVIMFASFAAAILTNLIIDFWGYNTWAITPWNYFYHNLINSRASSFGESPWYSYFAWIISKSGNPIGGLVILAALIFQWIRQPKSLITLITLPFILFHILIGHKELRFLFPIAFFVPLLLAEVLGPLLNRKYAKACVYFFVFINLTIGLALSLRPASSLISIYSVISEQKTPMNKLYYFGGENPLRPGDLPMSWYIASSNFETVNINNAHEIPFHESSLVFTDRYFRWQELIEKHHCNKISKSYFEFLYHMIPDKIMSKTRMFDLWKCQAIGT